MKKTITFKKPFPTPSQSTTIIYIFPFASIDTELIGAPEEIARTRQHQINVIVTFSLLTCWGFDLTKLKPRQTEIEKILFEYSKRYISNYKTDEPHLPEILELQLTTKDAEIPCPYDPSRIQAPDGFVLEIEPTSSGVSTPATHRVLFLSSDPKNATRLRLDTEQREISEKLRLSKNRNNIEFIPQVSLRVPDLSQALLDYDPTIIHFSGHGSTSGAICLEDVVGNNQPVSAQALALLFEPFKSTIKCIVLNACHSATQADSIVNHIDYVIGMNQAIGDAAATAFSIGFYQAVGAGKSIEDSFKLGVAQIAIQGIPEHLTPQLHVKPRA